MENKRTFHILSNKKNDFEIMLRAFLSKKELYSEINFIFISLNFNNSINFSQILSTKVQDDLYKLEIQITADFSKKKQISEFLSDVNYKNISQKNF